MKLTRPQLAVFLTDKGYKTSIHALNRLCQPSVNEGPPVAGRWGPADIYEDTEGLEWAQRRAAAAREKHERRALEHKEPVPKQTTVSKPRPRRRA